MELDRNGDVFVVERDVVGKTRMDDKVQIAYIQNPDGLDFYDTYPFYIDCESVKCTRPELDEMPLWYYTPTVESGDPTYVNPFDNHAGYLRASLAVGAENLYYGASTPYDYSPDNIES